MPNTSIQAESANATALHKYNENEKSAHEGLDRIKDWKNSLGHRPFFCASMDDGNIPLTQAHGMIEIMSALFSAGRDADRDNDITNISDSTVAAALDGISSLLSMAQLEADCFEHSRNLRKGGAA